jgi:hypothetical protein
MRYLISHSLSAGEFRELFDQDVRRWEDSIKIDFREIGWDGMDWIDLAQGRDKWRALVNTVVNLRIR